jgi:hypothetical protein
MKLTKRTELLRKDASIAAPHAGLRQSVTLYVSATITAANRMSVILNGSKARVPQGLNATGKPKASATRVASLVRRATSTARAKVGDGAEATATPAGAIAVTARSQGVG